MTYKYWRVVCRYGHVGRGKEISVARYLADSENRTCLDISRIANGMPGVKHNGVAKLEQIDRKAYLIGKTEENENFYLQKLRTHKKSRCLSLFIQ